MTRNAAKLVPVEHVDYEVWFTAEDTDELCMVGWLCYDSLKNCYDYMATTKNVFLLSASDLLWIIGKLDDLNDKCKENSDG